jgi:hypothetical protein
MDQTIVAALKRELAGYIADGNVDRANQVRAQLAKAQKTGAIGPEENAVGGPEETRGVTSKLVSGRSRAAKKS